MKKLVTVASLAALILTSYISPAAAQGHDPTAGAPAAAAPAAATPARSGRDKGLMLRVGIGVDGCTDDFCDDIDPMVAVRLVVLYRLLKYVAAGVHTAFLFGDPDTGLADRAWNLFLGVEGRGILPYKQFDFWLGLALGFNRTMLGGDQFIPGFGVVDGRYWQNAFGLGFGFGGDYFITKNIGVGLNFYMYKAFPQRACFDTDVSDTDCGDLSESVKDDIGIIWSVNAMFTYYLPL